MLEVIIFFVVLAVLRLIRRPQRSVRVDVYHHWPDGGPGERRPGDQPLLADSNVVPLRRSQQ